MGTMLLLAALAVQTVNVTKGWGAYLFEVTPEEPDPAAVFAGTGVTKAFCYLPDALNVTKSYGSDGKALATDLDGVAALTAEPSYHQWVLDNPAVTDLRTVVGGYVYVLYAPSATTVKLSGDPAIPHFHWRRSDASGNGVASLAAPSLDEGRKVSFKTYFGEGPCADLTLRSGNNYQNIYYFTGIQPSPVASPVRTQQQAEAGKAYGFTASREADWPGVVDVRGVGLSGIHFDAEETQFSFQIRNAGTTNRVIALAYDPSAFPSPVPLSEFDATNKLSFALEAGDAVTVTLHCDPTERLNEQPSTSGSVTNLYQGFLTAYDETGGTGMRVRFPVKADSVPAGQKWPTGFYIGTFVFDRVGVDDTAPTAGGMMKGRLIVHIDADGNARMIQRLALGRRDGVTVVYKDLEDEPDAAERAKLRRVSVTTMDPENPIVQAQATVSQESPEAVFKWTVGADSPSNPYYHALHPDHDGIVYNGDGTVASAPDGDDAKKYLNATKPELFSIRNEVTLDFESLAWRSDETLTGTVRWRIFGLRKMISDSFDAGVMCKGTFRLERVCASSGFSK